MRPLSKGATQAIIALVAILLFVPGAGHVHLFDWDEINFAEIAREMLTTGDWSRPQIDFQPFYEKPPLFPWMQAACMGLFGVGEFAARLPDAVCGVVTLVLLYTIGRRLRNNTFGLLWVLAYVGSLLPHLYFRSGIIDPWFNLFIFLAVIGHVRSIRENSMKHALIAGVLLGLAILTKGPVAFLVFALTIGAHMIIARSFAALHAKRTLVLLIAMLVTSGLYFAVDVVRHGPEFLLAFFERQKELFMNEDAGHGGFPGYHFVVLLIGCFPASLFAIAEMIKGREEEPDQRDMRRWMLALFWTVLLLFSIVNTKIVHYSSLCYFPLAYLAARWMERLWKAERQAPSALRIALGVIGNILAVAAIAVPFIMQHPEKFTVLINDPFARAHFDIHVMWTGLEGLGGVLLFAGLIAAHFLFRSLHYRSGLVVLFTATLLFTSTTLYLLVPRIERYSQGGAVDFFEEHAGEHAYFTTKGYKSYAQLFYARAEPYADPRMAMDEWLLRRPVDRPVYAVCRVTQEEIMAEFPSFKRIGGKGGYSFFLRMP